MNAHHGSNSRRRLRWSIVVAAICAATFAGWWYLTSRNTADLFVNVPPQNAYDEFIAAAKTIDPAVGQWNEADDSELARLEAANAEALKRVRAALDGHSVVPVQRELDNAGMGLDPALAATNRVTLIRAVDRAMLASIGHAKAVGDDDRARNLAIDLLRFSRAAAYGGLGVDHLMAPASYPPALDELEQLAEGWDADTLRDVERRLRDLEEPVEPAEQIVDRDIAFGLQQYSVLMRLTVMRGVAKAEHPGAVKVLRETQDLATAGVRRLRVHLAALAFQREHRRPPASINELVPEYLPEAPNVPGTNNTFELQPTDDGFNVEGAESLLQGTDAR